MIDNTASEQRRLPDPRICRTRYLGKSLGFTDCLVDNPDGCEYALRLASGVICRHPDRREFDETHPP